MHPHDFERFTLHNGCLIRLVEGRVRLEHELQAFHNHQQQQKLTETIARPPNVETNSPGGIDSHRQQQQQQFQHFAELIVVSENRILALLSLMHSPFPRDEADESESSAQSGDVREPADTASSSDDGSFDQQQRECGRIEPEEPSWLARGRETRQNWIELQILWAGPIGYPEELGVWYPLDILNGDMIATLLLLTILLIGCILIRYFVLSRLSPRSKVRQYTAWLLNSLGLLRHGRFDIPLSIVSLFLVSCALVLASSVLQHLLFRFWKVAMVILVLSFTVSILVLGAALVSSTFVYWTN